MTAEERKQNKEWLEGYRIGGLDAVSENGQRDLYAKSDSYKRGYERGYQSGLSMIRY